MYIGSTCQHLFLSLLYKQRGAENMLFKGGTALKIAYQSPRYSEDLDFSLFNITFRQIENLLLSVIEELEKINLSYKIVDSKETSGGYLAHLSVALYEENINILIQGSTRKKDGKETDIRLIKNDLIPPYTITLLPEKELVEEKIQAAMSRSKPRDFFDVYFLLRSGKVPNTLVSKVLLLPQIIKKRNIDFEELSAYLPISMSPLVKDFEKTFNSEVSKFS
ncbi:MAG: nucleotidyl transferase AbiEii/AbiGii toxin family protein [Patescibacteria group bacterium]